MMHQAATMIIGLDRPRAVDSVMEMYTGIVKYACYIQMAYICLLDNSLAGVIGRFVCMLMAVRGLAPRPLSTNSMSPGFGKEADDMVNIDGTCH